MIFFVKFIYAILPSAFVLGLLRSYYQDAKVSNVWLISSISFCLGAIIQKFFMDALYDSEFVNVVGAILLVLFLGFLFTFLLVRIKAFFYAFCSVLFLYSGGLVTFFVHDLPITGTEVINSDLVLHVTYIFLALMASFYMYKASEILSKSYFKSKIFNILLIASMLLYGLIVLGKIMQYLIKNDILTVTSARISFVAKVTYYSFLDIYVYMTFIGIFALIYFSNRIKIDTQNIQKPIFRKLKYKRMVQNRWLASFALVTFFTTTTLAYYDLVASRPPDLSPATTVQADENGTINLDVKDFMDGDLYRFAYITEDGHRVRFFAINRYKDKEKVVVVFDACMICGDLGYIKIDNQVVCLACNVRVFIPSIGQPGGCNPIPLKYEKKDGKITILAKTLEKGSTYFSEIVKREVTDIISGAKLFNTEAKYSYDYVGKTYYFENEENMEKFRDEPEKYVKIVERPRWRVQGHEEQK